MGAVAEQGDERDEGRDGKKKKNRCLSCKKKVGLTGELEKRTCNIKLIEISQTKLTVIVVVSHFFNFSNNTNNNNIIGFKELLFTSGWRKVSNCL